MKYSLNVEKMKSVELELVKWFTQLVSSTIINIERYSELCWAEIISIIKM